MWCFGRIQKLEHPRGPHREHIKVQTPISLYVFNHDSLALRNGYWYRPDLLNVNMTRLVQKLRTSTVTPTIPTFILSVSNLDSWAEFLSTLLLVYNHIIKSLNKLIWLFYFVRLHPGNIYNICFCWVKSSVLPDNILAKARYGKDFFSELNLASKQQAASTKNLHFVDFDRLAQMAHNGTGLK